MCKLLFLSSAVTQLIQRIDGLIGIKAFKPCWFFFKPLFKSVNENILFSMTAYPGQTWMTLGQLCAALWDSQSRLDVIHPGFKPRIVVTPLALRCSAFDCCATQEHQSSPVGLHLLYSICMNVRTNPLSLCLLCSYGTVCRQSRPLRRRHSFPCSTSSLWETLISCPLLSSPRYCSSHFSMWNRVLLY